MATKYQITIKGSDKIHTVKAESAEQAAIKGAAKHFFGFKAVSAIQVEGSTYSWEVAGKTERTELVFVAPEISEANEGVDHY